MTILDTIMLVLFVAFLVFMLRGVALQTLKKHENNDKKVEK